MLQIPLKFPEISFPGIQSGNYSEEWKRQRMATVRLLHKLGLGKETIQQKAREQTLLLVEYHKNIGGKL